MVRRSIASALPILDITKTSLIIQIFPYQKKLRNSCDFFRRHAKFDIIKEILVLVISEFLSCSYFVTARINVININYDILFSSDCNK